MTQINNFYYGTLKKWIEYCSNQHDVVVNQKYNDNLPYSFHLQCTAATVKELMVRDDISEDDRWVAIYIAWGHDLIEDTRLTYNDVYSILSGTLSLPISIADRIANGIYYLTELRGKNRDERHGPAYISGLIDNDPLYLCIKLCDIVANMRFSRLTGSSMYKKYKEEITKYRPHPINKLGKYFDVYNDIIEVINQI